MNNYQRYGKKWRKENKDRSNEFKKENYARGKTDLANEGRRWQKWEIELIFAEVRPTDRELAKQLGRSVQAIQVKRAKYLKERSDSKGY